jgi:hypothetical protein
LANTVFGSIVRWYSDKCGGANAKAVAMSRPGLFQRLAGQREHQVEVEVVEVGVRDLDRLLRLVLVVDAAQRLQMPAVEALDADRQAVDAAGAVGLELLGLEGAGIGFHRDLGVDLQRQQRAHVGQQAVQRCRRHQAGRAAADEHRVDLAAPDQRQRLFEVGAQRVQVGLLRHRAVRFVRIEIAVRALAHAPGPVDVQRQRRQRRQVQRTGLQVLQGGGGRISRRGIRCWDAVADGFDRDHFSFSTRARMAWPRWEMAFFSEGSSSAVVLPSAGIRKYGS